MKTIKISKKDEDTLRDGAVLIPNLISDRFKNSEKATCKDDHKLIIEQRTFFDLLYKLFGWDFTCEKHKPMSNKLGYVACHDLTKLTIPEIKYRFSSNDVDGAYLLGVFNASGIDGLSKEFTRLKKLKINPHNILDNIKTIVPNKEKKHKN